MVINGSEILTNRGAFVGDMSYFEISMRSYESIDEQFDFAKKHDWFNPFAAECVLIIERMVKGILSVTGLPDGAFPHLFESHSIHSLVRALHVKFPNTVKMEDAAWLENFYFETRYPGEDFIIVDEYEAKTILNITKTMAESLIVLYDKLTSSGNFYGGI